MDAFSAETADPGHRQRLGAAFAEALGAPSLEAVQAQFLDQALADYVPDELSGWDDAAFAGALADLWRLALAGDGERIDPAPAPDEAGRPLQRLSVCRRDMPFLVDSLMGELAAQGVEVRAMFHPVMADAPGRRSTVLVVMAALDDARAEAVLTEVRATLADVEAAVSDYAAMAERMRAAIDDLRGAPVAGGSEALGEHLEFLRWLTTDRFVFLGARTYDYPRDEAGEYRPRPADVRPRRQPGRAARSRALGAAPRQRAGGARRLAARTPGQGPAGGGEQSPTCGPASTGAPTWTTSACGGTRRTARPWARSRFVGLFTAEAYEEPARTLPLIRRKAAYVMAKAAENPSAHSERRLRHIVECYPPRRAVPDRRRGAAADRAGHPAPPRPAAGGPVRPHRPLRPLRLGLLFVPRERYAQDVQVRAGEILCRAWGGRVSAVYPSFSDGPLARLHYIIGLTPGRHPEPDRKALEAELVEAVRTWGDRFEAALRERADRPHAGADPGALARRLPRRLP